MKTVLAVAAAAVVGLFLGGCSTAPVASSTPDFRVRATEPAAQAAAIQTPLPCTTPSEALVRRGSDVLAAHPGPITAATLVPAAKTDTGQWFVLGIDRAYATDDGALGGGSSRGLALTNADPVHAVVIPLTHGPRRANQSVRWARVNWTGDVLALGKRAASQAFDCLDQQR